MTGRVTRDQRTVIVATMRCLAPLLLAAALLTSCSRDPQSAVTLSVIGGDARAGNPNSKPLDAPALTMTGALMQGLVQFDARGEIEPALAERWMVTDDGLSYIFRIRRTHWSDGAPVSAFDVAKSLRASLRPGSRNPLRPWLTDVAQVLPMTDSVVEVRLSEPLPGLLNLLADPHMAITRNGRGTGPYRLDKSFPSAKILRPVLTSDDTSADGTKAGLERRIRGENAARAIARYAERNAALVLGGDVRHYPLIAAAGIPARDIRIDPVPGLFGLVPARITGPSQNRVVRQALAMAVDRTGLIQRMGARGWVAMDTLLPGPIDGQPQARPDWAALNLSDRKARAQRLIAQTMAGRVKISVAMPSGPGARLIFAQLATDWRGIGVDAISVEHTAPADFRLMDEVVPAGNSLGYFLPFACGLRATCSAETSRALWQARQTPAGQRAPFFAAADRAITEAQLFIPLARPLRWSLVAPQLTGFATNVTGIHPLNRLAATAP